MCSMSQTSKQELIDATRPRYLRADRQQKSLLLNALCETTGHDRKYLIKCLRGRVKRRQRPPGRKRVYGPEAVEPLKAIWQKTEQLCSKRLKEALPLWLPAYEEEYGALSQKVRQQLLTISPAQIDRLLKPYRVKGRRLGPKPGSLIKKEIPVRSEPWDVDTPGWIEADTVAHCGGTMFGNFVWSLTLTDIDSGWTSLRSTWNCGQHGVLEQIVDIEANLPFALLGFDSDNGGEFLNKYLLAYFRKTRAESVVMTRSRPYRKNDNAHVEQKNWTHVRQLLGNHRLGDPVLVERINQLYKEAWEPLHNFFMPSVKLIDKEKLKDGRWRKVYDTPTTPCDRLLAWSDLPDQKREWLEQTRASLNPLRLKDKVEAMLADVLPHGSASISRGTRK